jgi:hypothetical protein
VTELLIIPILLGTILLLRLSGRDFFPDTFRLTGPNSRYVFDWYTPSHIIHGFAFYAITGNIVLTILLEAIWEVIENSPWVINRYRQTASYDYAGDTILNSLSDLFACTIGWFIAREIAVYHTVVLTVGLELVALAAVRDNLTLNIVMLVYPFETIKRWQQDL